MTKSGALRTPATPGPWSWASHTTADGDEWAVFDPSNRALAYNRDGWAPDAEFIANARTWIPDLLDYIDELEFQIQINNTVIRHLEARAKEN